MASHINSIGSQRGKTRIHVYFTFLLFSVVCAARRQDAHARLKVAASCSQSRSRNQERYFIKRAACRKVTHAVPHTQMQDN